MTRSSKAPFDEATKIKIRKLYAEGVMPIALAERFGVTQPRIAQILKEKDAI